MLSAGRAVHRLGLGVSALLGALVLLWLASASLSARADQGVAVDLGRIAVDDELSKGGSYQLPMMGVTNPGTETTRYRMGVSYFEGQTEEKPPEDWFTFSPEEFELEPGKTQPVTMSLRIPTGARPADYLALLQSSIVSSKEGTQVGAAAGARLSFTVKPSTLVEAWTLRARGEFDDLRPWSYLVPAALIAVAAALWVRRKFSFSVSRRG